MNKLVSHSGPLRLRSVWKIRRAAELSGATTFALFALILPAHAGGVNILSGKGGAGAAPAAAASQAAAQQGAAAAQQAAQQSVNALTKASQAIQAMRAAQSAARSLAIQAPTNVTNGLSPGGLVVDPRVGTDPSLWVNASKPTQQVTNGQVTVTIEQQAQKALLTWQQFNVGRETTVRFDQSKGNAASGNNWVALNRINATGAPSQILGQIKAEGTVLLINPNGIIFNGSSQVNVGSLIASSASIDPAAFMSTGIYSTQSGSTYLPSFTNAGGKISVEAGAEITTAAPKSVTSGGGYVMLMGTEVSNAGSISTPKGQALLSAGDSFILRSGYSTVSNQFSTTRGTEIAPVINVGSAAGKVTNAGLIFAQQGDITLAGHDVTQGGILISTTSVNQRGTIHLLNAMNDASGSVTLTSDAVTAILPELDSKDTALDSQRDALIAASAAQNLLRAQAVFGQFNNLSTLADRLNQSRVEIVTGGNAVFQGGSYTAAQGGQITVQAGKRIFTETGATLDVSGVRNVALAMESNNLQINVQGNELRDSPQNRDSGYLANENVWIDVRNLTLVPAGTGGYASDRYYTPGGLLEVGGYLGNTAHSIGEWTAVGGTVTLSAPEIVAQKGSIFNLSGGSVAYQGGYIRTTNFLGADGRLYNIGDNAPADMKYYGVGSGFIRDHEHWGQTEVWMNPFGLNRDSYRWEDGYTVGRDAGRLILSTPTSVFEGDILASVIQGERQINSRPTGITDGYKATQNTAALAGQLAVGAYGSVGRADAYASDVRIGGIAGVTPGMGATDALDPNRTSTVWLDADWLNRQKLGGIDIATKYDAATDKGGRIVVESDLTLADGGALNLTAPIIDINANIAARGGSVIASNQLVTNEAQSSSVLTRITDLAPGSGTAGVTLRANKAIDMGGVWTNALLNPNDLSGLAFVNGGGVTLRSTGDVTLENGSLVNASSGGAILATGKTQGGRGGDVSLLAGYNGSSGALTLNGAVAGYGAKGGGSLSLSTGGLVVIGDAYYKIGDVLPAGTVTPADVTLSASLVIPAGVPLPATYNRTVNRIDPGTALPADIAVPAVTLQANWLVPDGVVNVWYTYSGGFYQALSGATVPSGATLLGANGLNVRTLPAGYVLPADVFPAGLSLLSSITVVYQAGTAAPAGGVTFEAGTQIAAGTRLPTDININPVATLLLDDGHLRSGFSKYSINGQAGLHVADGAVVAPVMPVFEFTAAAYSAPTGSDASKALGLWLPDAFMADPIKARLTQRGGVDLELLSGHNNSGNDLLIGGSVTIGNGASVTVDPSRKVTIASGGQITVDGHITAHGGEIAILNRNQYVNSDGDIGGRSVWIGEHARLDVSAQAITAIDASGHLYGAVSDGGSVFLGSNRGDKKLQQSDNSYSLAEAYVVVRDGAVIDASGTSANLDILFVGDDGRSAYQRRSVASSGGTISLGSKWGLYNDGMLLARAGGVGASGGTLAINLESRVYARDDSASSSPRLIAGRVLHISDIKQSDGLPANLFPGAAADDLKPGYASLSAEEVARGGFDTLSLFARTAIVFEGDANLAAGRSITLNTSALYNSVAGGKATVSAPYVKLDGAFVIDPGYSVMTSVLPAYPNSGTIVFKGGLIDVVNHMNANVANLTLHSAGDLRFLAFDKTQGDSSVGDWTVLGAAGDLDLIAQRIYPATDAKVQLYAGTPIDVNGAPIINPNSITPNTGTVTIGRHEDEAVRTPHSVFGRFEVTAGTIRQGGNLFAPLGAISLQALTPYTADLQTRVDQGLVEFLAGGITSVSAKGLVIPYGGTVDGVSFTVNGSAPLPYDLLTGMIVKNAAGDYIANSTSGRMGITATGNTIIAQSGAVLDLSGGGTLSGAAFVSGRGGSVDTLLYPLIASNPGNTLSSSGNKVYAIVPGIVAAPVGNSYFNTWTGSVAGVGEQITIPAGVPGLSAGTYTLLPANYALLPGGYRVELGSRGTTNYGSAVNLQDGSYITSATRSVGGTSIGDALFTTTIVTPGRAVRTYSKYNEQGYADFQLANAATFGTVRPLLPADGKFLNFNLGALSGGSNPRIESALRFDGDALFSPSERGYAGTLAVSGKGSWSSYQTDMFITALGSTAARSDSVITVAASEIAKIGASNLYLGSTPASGYAADLPIFNITVNDGLVRSLTLESGVALTGSQIILTAYQDIMVKSGASINTIGRGLSAPDTAATGLLFGAPAMLAISNGSVSLNPNNSTTSKITLENDSALYSEGSIAFTAGRGVVMGDRARFGTRDIELALPYINIGTTETLAAAAAANILPGGLALNQAVLDRLFRGDPETGSPAVKNLILSAANSINFYGSVKLSTLDASGKSVLDSFVLSTPAIYGYGTDRDSVMLTTDRLIWSSRSLYAGATDTGEPIYNAVAPGAIIANGPGTGHGVFNVKAREILFGYPENSQPQNRLQFNRLMLGFETVNLNASERITSNNTNTLSVWRAGDSPTSAFDPATYTGEQAALKLITPLLTGANGSVMSIYSGGVLSVLAPDNGSPANTVAVNTLGATLNLKSVYSNVILDTAVALPSGRLTVNAQDTIQINEGTRIDLSGRSIPFNDVAKYSWGGDVSFESSQGSILVFNGAAFDVSAVNNNAGSIAFSAVNGYTGGNFVFIDRHGAPLVSLDGMFKGSSTDGYKSGSFALSTLYMGSLDLPAWSQDTNFARMNRALNAGGFFETRDFSLKKGNLTIGDEVRAHHVIVSLNDGNLTVNGMIDATGEAPGSIRLSAKDDLTLTSNAVLDVRGTKLQVDGDGVAIEAKNRGHVELTSTRGVMHLNAGATLDLRSTDGAARGDVVLNVSRLSETAGARIDARAPVTIRGAGGITLNAFWTYSPADADGSIVQDNGAGKFGSPVNAAGVLGLKQIDTRNVQYMNAALADMDLVGRLEGLSDYGSTFHFRPGVNITSSGASGNLTVKGDLDLSSYRYGPSANRDSNSSSYGAGEPLTLWMRARNDLTIKGSISDGFAGVPGMPAQYANVVTTSTPNTFERASFAGIPFFYASWSAGTTFIVMNDGGWTVPNTTFYRQLTQQGFALRSTGGTLYVPGSTIPQYTALYSDYISLEDAPSSANLQLATRIVNPGVPAQSATSAAAAMLPAGSQSASIRLVSGGDLGSADGRAVQTLTQLGSKGNLVLSDMHTNASDGLPLPSVIRTGTGELDLIAGRDLRQDSPFGIYTAGTQINVGSEYSGVTSQNGYFTQNGGDVRIAAGHDLTGYIWQDYPNSFGTSNYAVNNWLVRQGDATTPAAWGTRFGSYVGGKFFGFSGIGTLGGGNLAVDVGNDAGAFNTLVNIPSSSNQTYMTTGLVLAVGGSGRVTSVAKTPGGAITGGTLAQTGGGDLSLDVGGRLNPLTIGSYFGSDDFNGSFTNVRGDIAVQAGSIGAAMLRYGVGAPNDPRAVELYRAARLVNNGGVGGPVVVIGDGSVALQARGDLVFGGAGDPGMVNAVRTGGSYFSLWRSNTAISLLSAGGNMVPLNVSGNGLNEYWSSEINGTNRTMLPPVFEAVAANGSLYWAGAQRIELAPSRDGSLELLAGDSLYANGGGNNYSAAWSVSGANNDPNSIPNPFRPGVSNAYFQFQPDTVTTNLHEGDDKVIRVYARNGDIVNFTLGDPTPLYDDGWQPRYAAAMPARIIAGRDIVNFGRNAYRSLYGDNELQNTPSLILNNDPTDISVIQAGRDILYAQVQIAGPGSLDVTAGRNLYLGDKGSIVSIGALATGDTRPGASILMQAGAGKTGPNYAGLLPYLDAANLAVAGTPLVDQPGKVAKTYEKELQAWLKERYAGRYTGTTDADARSFFATLAPEQQAIFLRQVYFAELKAGGREYNDASSSRYGSYLRGRYAIEALFPEKDARGDAIAYLGNITMFGGSGVRTQFGGDIEMLTPGGQQVVGVEGLVPAASAGIVTQGSGNISLYSKGSILLGLSRVMTTYGGNIVAWSAEGDINAGRGAKTTVVYTPPKRVYDAYGHVTLSPVAPSSGAGIATLNPIPEVPPGDIDLIAPLGTIDAGEAGIRVSGNVNLAALQIINAANIQVQGSTSGIPIVQPPNISGLTQATTVASATTKDTAPVGQGAGTEQPSIIIVEVVGYGGGDGSNESPSDEKRRKTSGKQSQNYDQSSSVQFVGLGTLSEDEKAKLTPVEKRNLENRAQ